MRFRATFATLITLTAVACVPPAPEPTPTPPSPRPAAMATPVTRPTPIPTSTAWIDQPQTPGDWRYAATGGGSVARFGEAASEARFAVECNSASHTVSLLRYGPAGSNAPMIVRTEFGDRSLAASASGDALRASLAATDSTLDAMAFSKGRFAVEVAGATPLYMPSWPEITRVIEDCR